ncbi:MAG TPA: restriction endonuclease subunit S [Candidatus Anaerobiospirillum stercoravium]|nr:restriction endonuclease subunit S [Candidatus Anaerobiospirillum stercoravium]
MKFSPLRSQLLQLAISGKLAAQFDSEPEVAQLGPAPAPDAVPFAIPPKWKWVQLGQVFSTSSGKFLKAAFINDSGLYPCYGANGIRGYTDTSNFKGTANIIGRVGSCGSVHMASGECYITDNAIIAQHNNELIDPRCAYFILTALNLSQYATATAQPLLNASTLAKVYYPLVPIEEQHRIVAIIDELMSTLDRIEEAYGEFEGPMTEHFRNSALQQAIQGQLVPQLDSEPEVTQLGPAPAPDEVPFEIPTKWKWVQIGALLPFGGSSNQVKPEQIPANSWLLGLEEIASNGDLIKKIRDWDSVGSTKNAFKAGDVLYSKMRPYLNKVIIADEPGFCSTELIVLDVGQAKAPLLADYLLCFLRSPYFVSYATTHSHGQKPRLDLELGKQAWMPLPPLEEQRRIVAKLEELFTGVEQLKSLVEFA